MAKRDNENTEKLHTCIVDAIGEKKGNNIISLELGNLPNAICQHFVICSADSTTQVAAIAENIEIQTKKVLNERVWQKGGYDNSIWIILDYVDVVVHIFQTEWRDFYKLEDLWADAKKTIY
ncbi:MAG TPA: ribosome silencing factor [Perlabentimonas sp.]|nr:ribosome silencing factor [Bacteroidales bacterium]MDD4672417.1 ribosome silencing factor [Bacteroidales bacterium]MDY0347309.1 ribosome silencing factor [Tenuifilaceae bacterium]HZJ73879.1 ribosome silencing factor [Perlabentimonas sp.]